MMEYLPFLQVGIRMESSVLFFNDEWIDNGLKSVILTLLE